MILICCSIRLREFIIVWHSDGVQDNEVGSGFIHVHRGKDGP